MEMPVVQPASITDTVKGVSNVALFRSTIKPRSNSSQRASSKGANQTPAMGGHEVDHLRGGVPCCNQKVPFVFPILVVDHDDEFHLGE